MFVFILYCMYCVRGRGDGIASWDLWTLLLQDWSRASGARARSPPPLSAASEVRLGLLARAWVSQPIKKYHKVSLHITFFPHIIVKGFHLNCIRLFTLFSYYGYGLTFLLIPISTFRYY